MTKRRLLAFKRVHAITTADLLWSATWQGCWYGILAGIIACPSYGALFSFFMPPILAVVILLGIVLGAIVGGITGILGGLIFGIGVRVFSYPNRVSLRSRWTISGMCALYSVLAGIMSWSIIWNPSSMQQSFLGHGNDHLMLVYVPALIEGCIAALICKKGFRWYEREATR
jgi:hypothetical protein